MTMAAIVRPRKTSSDTSRVAVADFTPIASSAVAISADDYIVSTCRSHSMPSWSSRSVDLEGLKT
jgi:hypothetical protein